MIRMLGLPVGREGRKVTRARENRAPRSCGRRKGTISKGPELLSEVTSDRLWEGVLAAVGKRGRNKKSEFHWATKEWLRIGGKSTFSKSRDGFILKGWGCTEEDSKLHHVASDPLWGPAELGTSANAAAEEQKKSWSSG